MEQEVVGEIAPSEIKEQEKSVPAERVQDLIKQAKLHGAEKERERLRAEHQAEIERLKAEMPKSIGGMQQEDPEKAYQKIKERLLADSREQQEELQKAEQKRELQKIADDYFSKMSKGKEQFEDFGEIMADFEPASFPEIAILAAKLDNTAGIMYELAKNPIKLGSINSLVQTDPKRAEKALKQLAESIAENQQAQENYISAQEPLSRLKPSASAGMDSGKMSLKDLKKMYRGMV